MKLDVIFESAWGTRRST